MKKFLLISLFVMILVAGINIVSAEDEKCYFLLKILEEKVNGSVTFTLLDVQNYYGKYESLANAYDYDGGAYSLRTFDYNGNIINNYSLESMRFAIVEDFELGTGEIVEKENGIIDIILPYDEKIWKIKILNDKETDLNVNLISIRCLQLPIISNFSTRALSKVDLSWAGDADSYVIERAPAIQDKSSLLARIMKRLIPGNWQIVGNVIGNNYRDEDVLPYTSYYYRIKGDNSFGSVYSNVVNLKVPAFCIDTDSLNIYLKGNATSNALKPYYSFVGDSCFVSNGYYYVREAICYNGIIGITSYKCINGCVDGACIGN